MVQAIEEPGGDPILALDRVARRFGESLGAQARRHLGRRRSASQFLDAAGEELRKYGFEPTRTNGEVRLRNCPFDAIAKDHTELVCGMNLSLTQGLLDGLQAKGVDARLDPQAGMCCVALACGRRSRRL
jgi:predicted ArsR family transcriptional regulator